MGKKEYPLKNSVHLPREKKSIYVSVHLIMIDLDTIFLGQEMLRTWKRTMETPPCFPI